MKRKPIQITAVPRVSSTHGFVGYPETLYALCDDGSIWFLQWTEETTPTWERVQDIPQP